VAKSATATKTVRQQLAYRPGVSEWFASTRELFNQVVAFYFSLSAQTGVIQAHLDVLKLSNKEALTALERLTHATKQNPDPVVPLSEVAAHIPAMFRRAAINTALGAARSFHSNLVRWRREKEQAEARGRRFNKRPPVPPRNWNRWVAFYAGMWKQRTNGRITLKLWDGGTWRWVRFRLSGREIPEDWKAGSPQVVRRGRTWWLHTPIEREMVRPQKVEMQIKSNPGVRLCAVDQNVNDALAVCTILEADGTVVATRFIRGGRELHGRRKSLLGRVARKRSETGIIAEDEQDNADLWRKIRNLDEDTAHRVSRRIVEFAQEHGAAIIVFEHLGRFRPERGKYSRRANEKRSYWLRGRIFEYTRYKGWEEGLVTCRVNPRDTSRECADCGSPVARHGEGEAATGYRPGAPLVTCLNPACGMRGNADRNASRNIGQRLLARYLDWVYPLYQEKPHARPLAGRASKEAGVSCSQGSPEAPPEPVEERSRRDAENGSGLHTDYPSPPKPERHGVRNGHGTARNELNGAAFTQRGLSQSVGIPRSLRPQRSGGYAASTSSDAYPGVPEEAAAL
jgi:putative transposase